MQKNRMFLYFIIFLFMPMIGTLIHEFGHFTVAKWIGMGPRLHYGSCTYSYLNQRISQSSIFWLNASGPILTILIGSVGFISQFMGTPKQSIYLTLNKILALFWIREFLIFIVFAVLYYFNIIWSGDETRCSNALGINPTLSISLLGILGLFICVYTLFFYSKLDRREFIFGAVVGSIAGGWGWFSKIGPILLP